MSCWSLLQEELVHFIILMVMLTKTLCENIEVKSQDFTKDGKGWAHWAFQINNYHPIICQFCVEKWVKHSANHCEKLEDGLSGCFNKIKSSHLQVKWCK